MAYYEGEIGGLGGYNNNGFGTGWEGIIGLALVASLFGGGWGGFGGNRSAGSEAVGYELGKVATTNDVASGFNNSAVLGNLSTIRENQLQMQNWVNQGFNGVNSSISNCCCQTQRLIERSTNDIIQAGNANTQRILDYLCAEKISGLQAENVSLKGQISNYNQTAAIVSALKPTPVPSYNVPNPNCCYNGCAGIQ